MQNKAIILTGMMGSGKTTAGRKLAQMLDCDFFDLDEIIEKKYGPISDIFKNKGEEYFRDLETTHLLEFCNHEKIYVLSLGGGAVLRDKNIEIIKKLGRGFFLEANADAIYNRIKNQTHRPLLNTLNAKETIQKILISRLSQYEKSGEKIPTQGKTIQEVAGAIYEKLKS